MHNVFMGTRLLFLWFQDVTDTADEEKKKIKILSHESNKQKKMKNHDF